MCVMTFVEHAVSLWLLRTVCDSERRVRGPVPSTPASPGLLRVYPDVVRQLRARGGMPGREQQRRCRCFLHASGLRRPRVRCAESNLLSGWPRGFLGTALPRQALQRTGFLGTMPTSCVDFGCLDRFDAVDHVYRLFVTLTGSQQPSNGTVWDSAPGWGLGFGWGRVWLRTTTSTTPHSRLPLPFHTSTSCSHTPSFHTHMTGRHQRLVP